MTTEEITKGMDDGFAYYWTVFIANNQHLTTSERGRFRVVLREAYRSGFLTGVAPSLAKEAVKQVAREHNLLWREKGTGDGTTITGFTRDTN